MNTKRFTISITAGIAVVLLLIVGTGATTIILNTAHAQTATLGEPFFVEKGKSQFRKKSALTEHNTLLLPMER